MNQVLDYRPATFSPVPTWRRWWPLARQEATVLFRSKWGVALFFVCLLPAFVRLAMLLILFGVVNFGPDLLRHRARLRGGELARLDPMRAEFYVEPVLEVMPGMVFALLLSTLVIARSVARDRPTNALELYWTRGISPASYVLAKWVGSTLLLATITVAAPLALWLTAVFLAEDWSLFTASAGPVLLALGAVALVTAVWSAMGVLISAAAATPNGAMVGWALLLVGSSGVATVLSLALRDRDLPSAISVWLAGGTVARAIAGIPQRYGNVGGAVACLAIVLALAWLRARRHLRVGEAVG